MLLLDPRKLNKKYEDSRSTEVMEKTVEFFENKGKNNLLKDYYGQGWYDDFINYAGKEGLFATISTPEGYGADDSRWDTWRICEFAEILGFYGLQYWYVWQVSVLGLGPIWMSENEEAKKKTVLFGLEGPEKSAFLHLGSRTKISSV